MASTGNFNLSTLHFYTDDTEQLLICCHSKYRFAFFIIRSQATSYLRDKYNTPKKLRDSLTRYLKNRYPYSFRNPVAVAPRDNGSQAHPILQVYNGFACRKCPYRTINYAEYSRHALKEHLSGMPASRQRVDPYYNNVYLQTWTHGSSRRYWTVKKNGSTIRPVAGRGVSEHIQGVQQRESERAERQEQTYGTNMANTTLAGTRPWMERTRWEITYQGFRRDILWNPH